MFADDVKLCLSFNSIHGSKLLQSDLENLEDLCLWCAINGMVLNSKKCKKMSFAQCSTLPSYYRIDNHIQKNVRNY